MNRDALWKILGLYGVPPKLINLISELYSGTESAVMCDVSIFNLFPVDSGNPQGCVLAPTLFSACVDWILRRMSEKINCGASFGNVCFFYLGFTYNAVIYVEMLDILMVCFDALNEESKLLRIHVSSVKIEIQAIIDILDAAILSVSVCGEHFEVKERFIT